MEKVMVVSSAKAVDSSIKGLLKEAGYSNIITVQNGAMARRTMVENDVDIVIINCPLSDEFGMELAEEIVVGTNSSVMLLVKSELLEEVSYEAEKLGIFVLSKPLSKVIFYQSLRMLHVAYQRISGLKKENDRLKNRIADIRLVEQAKYALIHYCNMSENEAHHYIEKNAMDQRISKREVAKNIISKYNL